MRTTIKLRRDRKIGDVQSDFNRRYPFLKIDFMEKANGKKAVAVKHKLNQFALLNSAGVTHEGDIVITDSMKVGELEQAFHDRFGVDVQVSRKSGIIWLETTMTDNWTLKQQNDHGRELSEPLAKPGFDEEADVS